MDGYVGLGYSTTEHRIMQPFLLLEDPENAIPFGRLRRYAPCPPGASADVRVHRLRIAGARLHLQLRVTNPKLAAGPTELSPAV
jgi:hypothetical protein